MEKQFIIPSFLRWLRGREARCVAATLRKMLKPIPMLCVFGAVSTAHAVIPTSQRTVLTNLYTSTNGASWTNKTNWNSGVGTECTWYGVSCDGMQSNVVTINLSSNNLVGTLPALSGVPALQVFDAQNNQLTGTIPSLNGLTALQYIHVGTNRLTGAIPALGGLPTLRYFHGGGNQLTGSIPALSGLTALQSFHVGSNQLTGSIPALSGLTALQDISLNSNQLTGSIPALNGLTALQLFFAHHNQLTGSIPSLNGLTALQSVQVSDNRLTGPVPAPPASLISGGSNLCNNFLTTSGITAIDAAWDTAAGNWQACQILPIFPMVVTGSVTPTIANITAAIQYRPQDVGTTGSVYVFALAPASLVTNVSAEALSNHKGPVARSTNAADTPLACVLAQLTASGQLTAVTAGTLQAYLTGVLSSQGASVSVLNGVSTALISGVVFYVGYGTNSTSMINGGIHRNVVTVPADKTCQPQAPQTGWWWNPAEDGRGFGIEVRGNNLFMSGYLYDDTGHATWVVSPGPVALDGSLFNGTLYQVANGQTLTGTYKAPSPPTSPGSVTLSFTDARNGTLIWPGGSIPLVRFDDVIGSGNGATPSFVPENGWWWNESESGRGFFMEFKNNFAFMAGYMYETDGRPVWYVAQNPLTTPQTFSSTWLQVANGQTMTGPYKKPAIVNSNVGPVNIQFIDAANAVMTLPGGRQLAITRQRF